MLEERKKFFIAPLKDHVKDIEVELKLVSEPLIKADTIIRAKVVEWRNRLAEQARKKEEELQRKAEKERQKQIDKAEAKGEAPPPPAPIPKVEVPKTTEGITTVKTWTYEVENIDKVPREYLALDSGAVMRAVREGIREIPGIRIYQKETVKVRT